MVKRILLNESGIFYKINIIYCAEFSCAELSGNLYHTFCLFPSSLSNSLSLYILCLFVVLPLFFHPSPPLCHSAFISLFLSAYLHFYLRFSVLVYFVCRSASLSLSLSACLQHCLSFPVLVCLSFCLRATCLSWFFSASLSLSFSTSISLCFSASLSIRLSVDLSPFWYSGNRT